MSILASTLDGMISKLGTLFPSYSRLANPYSLDQNAEPFLSLGYGIKLLGASNSKKSQSVVCVDRKIAVVQTRSYIAIDSDPTVKEDTEKLLISDQMTLIKDLEVDFTLGGVVQEIAYASDAGIESVYSNQKQFLKIETQFSVQYIESLT